MNRRHGFDVLVRAGRILQCARGFAIWTGLTLLIGSFLTKAAAEQNPPELQLSVASSLSPVISEICAEFSEPDSVTWVINSGSTGVLVQQIKAGASADILIAADPWWIEKARLKGLISDGYRTRFASNQLVLVTSAESPLEDFSWRRFLKNSRAPLIIGQPASVPVGRAAVNWLDQFPNESGNWREALTSRLAIAGDARGVIALVRAHPSALGIAYRSDVVAAAATIREVDASGLPEAPMVAYEAAVLRSSENRDQAIRFLSFLSSSQARARLLRQGFSLSQSSVPNRSQEIDPVIEAPPLIPQSNLGGLITRSVTFALAATIVSLICAVPLALAVSRYQFPGRSLVSALASLPLVLPPTAVGFLLLESLAPRGWLNWIGVDLLLEPPGAILAATVMAFPLIYRTALVTFDAVPPELESLARTLGHRTASVWLKVTFPLAAAGVWAAAILGFTRALGEFGATILVAGSIPHRTETLASAIYLAHQAGDDQRAFVIAGFSIGLGLIAILTAEWLIGRAKSPPVAA
ncbi:MAG: molybdate ABC transporter substrate-binding protein [Verrucomicrobiota bacterium]